MPPVTVTVNDLGSVELLCAGVFGRWDILGQRMEWSSVLCVVASVALCSAEVPYCPPGSQEDEPATLAVECYGDNAQLLCCMDDFDSIRWMKKNMDGVWEPYWRHEHQVYFPKEERNQTLKFEPTVEGNEGYYQCIVSKQGRPDTSLTIHLRLIACAKYLGSAEILNPTSGQSIYNAEVGQKDIRLPCVGFCGMLGNQNNCESIFWRRFIPLEIYSEKKPPNTTDTHVEDGIAIVQGNALQMNLVFPVVRKEDFGTYECTVTSTNGHDTANITLTEQVHPPDPGFIVGVMFGCIAGLSVLLVLVAMQKDRILLVWMLRFNRRRHIPGKQFDALIIGEDDMMGVAQAVRDNLEHYSFTLADEILPNEPVLAALGDRAERSVNVVVLLSRALVTVVHYLSTLNSLLEPKNHQHTIVFVVLEADWEEAWRRHMNTVIPEDKKVIEYLLRAVQAGGKLRAIQPDLPVGPVLKPAFLRKLQLKLGTPLQQTRDVNMAEDVNMEAQEPFV